VEGITIEGLSNHGNISMDTRIHNYSFWLCANKTTRNFGVSIVKRLELVLKMLEQNIFVVLVLSFVVLSGCHNPLDDVILIDDITSISGIASDDAGSLYVLGLPVNDTQSNLQLYRLNLTSLEKEHLLNTSCVRYICDCTGNYKDIQR
jgi:hypothetical protein